MVSIVRGSQQLASKMAGPSVLVPGAGNMNDNIALVKKVYDAFGRGDVQTILDSLTPDVEWQFDAPAVIPYSGSRRGPAEVAGFFAALAATEENQLLETSEFMASGDEVITLGTYSGKVKASGKGFSVRLVHVFTIRDGKIARFLDFLDTAAMADAHSVSAARA
jgi:ketosteroid isomerase-like protein